MQNKSYRDLAIGWADTNYIKPNIFQNSHKCKAFIEMFAFMAVLSVTGIYLSPIDALTDSTYSG